MVHSSPFVTPRLVTPKDIATKSREARSGTHCSSAIVQNVTPIDRRHRRRDIPGHIKNTDTPDLISGKTQLGLCLWDKSIKFFVSSYYEGGRPTAGGAENKAIVLVIVNQLVAAAGRIFC